VEVIGMRWVTLLVVCLLWGVGCSGGQEPVAVSGTERCTPASPSGDELERYECIEELDDARVSGEAVVSLHELDPPSVSPRSMVGAIVIENEGGSWTGDWTGVIEGGGLHVVNGVLVGSGDYEGLQFSGRWEWVDWPGTVTGTIEPTS
jgi:hypothetical protein